LRVRGKTLYRWGTDRREEVVASLAAPPPVPERADPLHILTATPPRGADRWNVHFGPAGQLEYGDGGVFRLDEQLRPHERLIDAGADRYSRKPHPVELLASDGRTIAVSVRRSEQPVIQVWTADGREKLREEPASFGPLNPEDAQRLAVLNDGYFFSGDELLWVPNDPARPAWRFALQPLPRHPLRQQDPWDRGFGIPRLVHGKVYVSCNDGGVFVFDTRVVTGGPPDPERPH
jgi:hypothetical protein